MSLDKLNLRLAIADKGELLVKHNRLLAAATEAAWELKREKVCLASKVFSCRKKTGHVPDWCDHCKLIGPLEYRATLAKYQVGVTLNAMTKLVEQRERLFPRKSKNGG